MPWTEHFKSKVSASHKASYIIQYSALTALMAKQNVQG